MKFKLAKIILVGGLLIGGLLRFIRLGELPQSLYWDEVAIGVDAHAISVWGKDMHGNAAFQSMYPSYGDYKLPLYILIDSLVVKLFGLTPWAVRLPSALAGMGLIYVVYLIGKQLFKNDYVASLSALVMALLPVEILFSRTGFEGHLAVIFIALSLLFWLKSFQTHRWLLLASVTAALAVYSYFSARIVIPLMGVVTWLSFIKQTNWKWKIFFILSMGFWGLLLLPISNSPFYEQSNQFRLSTKNLLDVGPFALESNIYREQSNNSLISRFGYHRYLLQAKAIAVNIATHWEPNFLFFSGDNNLRHSTGSVGLLYLSMWPLLGWGWWGLWKKYPAICLWLLGLWISSIVPAAIPLEVPHALRSLNSVIVLAIVVGFGTYELFRIKRLWLYLLSILVAVELGFFIHDYTTHYPARSAKSWQTGYLPLAEYLKLNDENFDQVYIDYPDGRLYLYFLFVNQTNPEEIAGKAENYLLRSFGKYNFEANNPVTNDSRIWRVISGEKWQTIGEPPAQLIKINNEVIFAIINGT